MNVDPGDLMRFAWPVTAIASISHRITGVILFVGVLFALYALEQSLSDAASFDAMKAAMLTPFGKIVTWGLLAALAYHFVAGVKHLLMDLEVADTLEGGRFAAKATLLFGGILVVLAAIWVFPA
ncbi:MAG: succinate dehydrogenase, cytochrome b556 subunit [Pseudomonadota bacterium]